MRPRAATWAACRASWNGITVRQLLNHTSGVPEYFDTISAQTAFPATRKAMIASLAAKPLLFSPGTAIRYTNTNYVVLAALLEAHYGEPYAQIADERIIDKLQLRHTWLGTAALPASGVAKAYTGENGELRTLDDASWPVYGYGNTALYSTLDDLTRFLQAISRGELVGKASLQQFWQPQRLPNGQPIWAATGWDVGESDGYREVGHDGGTHVRVRILFKGTLDGDVYTVAYLTNGSARNVWSGTLVDSAMARVAPAQFPAEVLAERLRAFALDGAGGEAATAAEARAIQANRAIEGAALERAIHDTGEAVRENLGADAAIRVFELGAAIFPLSANAWDSLAEAYEGKGDRAKAGVLRDKARRLSRRAPIRRMGGDPRHIATTGRSMAIRAYGRAAVGVAL